MKKSLILFLLLTCCQRQPEQAGNDTAGPSGVRTAPLATQGKPRAAITTLTGLYEGRSGAGPTSQLCMVDPSGEAARFGLVVWGANDHSCSGSGNAVRSGGRLQLKMTGDEACTIDAAIEGDTIVLPDSAPAGCAYYCGARASLGGARLTQVGTGRDDAAKARDLVGDPLC